MLICDPNLGTGILGQRGLVVAGRGRRQLGEQVPLPHPLPGLGEDLLGVGQEDDLLAGADSRRYAAPPPEFQAGPGARNPRRVLRVGRRAVAPPPPAARAAGAAEVPEGRGRMPQPAAPPPSAQVPPAELPASVREAGL